MQCIVIHIFIFIKIKIKIIIIIIIVDRITKQLVGPIYVARVDISIASAEPSGTQLGHVFFFKEGHVFM
jgi:hypothetical protein